MSLYSQTLSFPWRKPFFKSYCYLNSGVLETEVLFTWRKISVRKLTLFLLEQKTLRTISISVRCSSSILQRLEELGSLSVSVLVLEWDCSGSAFLSDLSVLSFLLSSLETRLAAALWNQKEKEKVREHDPQKRFLQWERKKYIGTDTIL